MKRSIISQYDQLKERLGGYVALLNYRYMNLCVKAEEASLLPVKINIEGELKQIEEVCNIAKKDDYSMMVFPKYEEDLIPTGYGIAKSHPEFKQERKNMSIELDDGQNMDIEYILITMPEVDKNRYDALKQAVNLLHDECKVEMKEAMSKTEAEIALMAGNEKKEDIDKLKEAVKEVDDTYNKKREQIHEEKLKEIEEAYKRYQQKTIAAEQKRKEDEMAAGDGGMSLDITQYQA